MTDFSYQLYSSRNFPPLAETLTMLARLGYAEVEGYGALYADPARVAELVDNLGQSGLRMPTGHFGLDMLENEPERALGIARALGIETIYCPYLLPDQRPDTGAGYEAFGARLHEAGKPIRDAGLGFGWHNHDFEFIALKDGTIPQEAIFAGGPELEWEADIAWVARSGADPFYWIDRFGDRITSVHLKDIAPAGQATGEDGWADVGYGILDWPGLMTALRATGARHFIMEHDNPADAARFAERSLTSAQSF
jgi:sugar phosphate isomerase/epimerase